MEQLNGLAIAVFSADITPAVGHPLCAGWMLPSVGFADPLLAKGIVLTGDGLPVVQLALDWCELSNTSYWAWRNALAEAVGTTPNRVSVHCMHPHLSPFIDERAQHIVEQEEGIRDVGDLKWCAEVLARVAAAAKASLGSLEPVTHLETGRAKVDQVASNRRIMGEDGTIKAVRWTRTFDAEVRAEPEGLIDPWLKTIGFWNGERKLAVLHYYAVHPSSYEDRYISPDFTGLARERRQKEDNYIPHLYFTECAGNITAGKYNDGNRANRELFIARVYRAMVESEADTVRVPVTGFQWRSADVRLPPREDMNEPDLMKTIRDTSLESVERCRAAMRLTYLERLETPIEITALHFDGVSIVHLPGESFIEYQLFAQEQRPNDFVVVPSYGDCGPGYICMETSFEEGGYEPYDSFVSGKAEAVLKAAIANVMKMDD